MNLRILITVMVLLCAQRSSGQGFQSVHSSDGTSVWVVGNGGLVYRSLDGGATWGDYSLTTKTLNGIWSQGTHLWAVGEDGEYHRSTDGGDTWSTSTINGGVSLRAVTFIDTLRGWAVGNSGTILATTNAGVSWSSQTSGTGQNLRAVASVDALTGYVAGSGGILLKTTNGGASWVSVAGGGWTRDLFTVAARGGTVYTAGLYGVCYKSTNGGSTWNAMNLSTDSKSDVNNIFAISPDTIFVVGGGGYIRFSDKGGLTWEWRQHQMHARLSDIFFYDNLRGWAVSDRNNAIMRTTDGGVTWLLPTGTVVGHSWSQKLSATSSIGNTFVTNALNREHLYVALGRFIYMSANRGESWVQTAIISPNSGSTHSFYISPKDTNLYIVAFTNPSDRVRRSTDRGVTWTDVLIRNFTSYGMPLEMDPDHPDTLLFAADGTGSGGANADGIVYRSMNFGLTWDTLANTNLRSPCDIIIVPDSSNLVYIGDGITGSGRGKLWRSTNHGATWALIDSVTGSEIPTLSISRQRNMTAYHTAWGSGGFKKTMTYGTSWTQVATTGSTWGTDVATDDPDVVMFGTYGGGMSYLSTNAGSSFLSTSLSGSNYAIFCYDRGTFLAQQSGGIYKMNITYTVPVNNSQALEIVAPNGGEMWPYNSTQNITWTSNQVVNVRLEYKTSPAGAWQTIVASTPALTGSYPWTIPDAASSQVWVRIRDGFDGAPVDSSNAPFSILVPSISSSPTSLLFDSTGVPGESRSDTVRIYNYGTGPLVITSVTTSTPHFTPGRTSFSIPAGMSDTLSVLFVPTQVGSLSDSLRLANNSPAPDLFIQLSGVGKSLMITNQYQVSSAWNLLSLPLVVSDPRKSTVFPGSTSPAYAYSNTTGYTSRDSLMFGTGYWLKFGSAATVSITGFPVPADTIPVVAGWNVVGMVSELVPASSVVQVPAGILQSAFFGYSGSYVAADTLRPGKAYWVKSGATGVLIIDAGPTTVSATTVSVEEKDGTIPRTTRLLDVRAIRK